MLARRFLSTTAQATIKEPASPLTKPISDLIKAVGAISISQYMRLALTHPQHGYYTQQEVFGAHGDFITSPEISQVFGELIGSWYARQFSEYRRCRYVELGPGTGSLLADMLSVWKQLRHKTNQDSNLVGIHLVEQSRRLREMQREKIEQVLGHRLENVDGDSSRARSKDWFTVQWHDDFQEVPVDALPVVQFQKQSDGKWAEVVVDLDDRLDTPLHFRFKLTDRNVGATRQLLDEFNVSDDDYQVGDIIELSSESRFLMNKLAEFYRAHQSGAALIVDYGRNDRRLLRSLRAIRQHKFVEPLSLPGQCDLTVDVDFDGLSAFINEQADETSVHASAPITQRHFLTSLGIDMRVQQLRRSLKAGSQEERALVESTRRLTQDMGSIYKVMLVKPGRPMLYPFRSAE